MSTRPAILDAFQSHAFLRRLDDRCLMDLASGVLPFAVAADGYLGRAGEPARAFYLVQSGTVSIELETEAGESIPIQKVGPGGVVGWSWVVPPYRWQFTCRAATPVTGLMFDADWLRGRCEANHELGYHLLRELIAGIAGQFEASRHELAQGLRTV